VASEEQLAVLVVDLDLGFEHPDEGRGDGDNAAGAGLAVVGLRPLEDLALVGGVANLEGLRRRGSTSPSLRPQSVKTRTIDS